MTAVNATFKRICSVSKDRGEDKDCSVRAVAAVCDCDYATAHQALRAVGRKDRDGAYPIQTLKAIESLGFVAMKIDLTEFKRVFYPPSRRARGLTTRHPVMYPKAWIELGGRILAFTSGHVLPIIDGINPDWSRRHAKRIVNMYRIEKM